MDEAPTLVRRALAGDRASIDALVAGLAPYAQRQVNAGLLRRGLVPQAGRHDVVDLVRDLLVALFDERGALLGAWDPRAPLEGYVEYLAYGQVAAVLDRVAPLPPDAPPSPGEAEAWWAATAAQDPSVLPVPDAARAHAQAILRPVEAHEAAAVAAEVARAITRAPPPASTPPEAAEDPAAPSAGPDEARQRRGLLVAAVLGVAILGAVVAGSMLGLRQDDSVPKFHLKARDGLAGAPARYLMGQRISVGLVPETPLEIGGTRAVGEGPDLTVAAVALGADDEVALWPYLLQQDTQGTLQLMGVVGQDLPVKPGSWRLVFIIGPREEVVGDAAVLALDPEPPPPPLQRLKYTIEVEAP